MDRAEQARRLGVALRVPITAAIRQPSCNASFAEFAGVEGNHALYLGECSCRHRYEIRVLIKNAQVDNQLAVNTDGTVGIGNAKGFKLGGLDEY